MATTKETVSFILDKLKNQRFSTRSMFGEYALYADGKVVGFICDNQLFIKILPVSHELEKVCEKDSAYPGSKPYYLITEEQMDAIENLSEILFKISDSLPLKKKKNK